MTKFLSAVVFAAAVAVISPVSAQSIQAADDASRTGDWATVYTNIQPLAAQGNAEAQAWLGSLYRDGHHVARDAVEGARWARLSAMQGNADAQYTMGDLYARGDGVPQDDVLAHIWLELATRNGNVWAAGNPNRARLTSAQIADAQVRINTCVSSNYQNCQ